MIESTGFGDSLRRVFGTDRVQANAPLAPLTTFKVGGPAEWFVEPRTSGEIVAALAIASQHGVAVTLLGGGSNVLVAGCTASAQASNKAFTPRRRAGWGGVPSYCGKEASVSSGA